MAVRLIGDWAKAAKITETMDKRFHAAAEQALLREGHYLRGKVVQNITSGGALAGKPFAPLSPATLAIRKFTGFGGSKILMRTGSLRNSVVVRKVGSAVFVGVMRKSGKGANIAEIHEFGAGPFTVVMTARQRRFLMAALSSFGGAPSPGKGGGVLVIKIPARPFMSPVFERFAKPADVKQRFWAHVSGALGGDLGK
jgi:phage gpG-like protein